MPGGRPITLRLVIADPVAGVGYSLQDAKGAPVDARVAGDGPLVFEVPATVAPDGRLTGPFVRREGPARRFVYIAIGGQAGLPHAGGRSLVTAGQDRCPHHRPRPDRSGAGRGGADRRPARPRQGRRTGLRHGGSDRRMARGLNRRAAGGVSPRGSDKETLPMTRMITTLWFDHGQAGEAARFYASLFPDTHVGKATPAPSDYPSGKAGDELTVEFTLLGQSFLGLNGGPDFKPNESVSFMIETQDQAETDKYWNAIVGNGGAESECGWCKDRWGFSWQITPRQLNDAMADPDPAVAKRVFEAMMTMRKIDVARIEAAHRGD